MNMNNYSITKSFILNNKNYYSYHNFHSVDEMCPKKSLYRLNKRQKIEAHIYNTGINFIYTLTMYYYCSARRVKKK